MKESLGQTLLVREDSWRRCVCAYVCVYTPLYVGKPKYYLFLNIHTPSVIYPILDIICKKSTKRLGEGVPEMCYAKPLKQQCTRSLETPMPLNLIFQPRLTNCGDFNCWAGASVVGLLVSLSFASRVLMRAWAWTSCSRNCFTAWCTLPADA